MQAANGHCVICKLQILIVLYASSKWQMCYMPTAKAKINSYDILAVSIGHWLSIDIPWYPMILKTKADSKDSRFGDILPRTDKAKPYFTLCRTYTDRTFRRTEFTHQSPSENGSTLQGKNIDSKFFSCIVYYLLEERKNVFAKVAALKIKY